jgi:uncharacterized membrane protein (UPF0136 family)
MALSFLTTFFLAGSWWFLVSQLIHEESLAGDRQFWVTRPYAWRSLLAAKLLFVVTFVNVPLLAAQVAILAAAGYRPLAGIPQLLWMQFVVAAILLAPAFALGTVTRNLAQFVLTILGGVLSWYVVLAAVVPSVAISASWVNEAVGVPVVCAGAALIVVWQFSRRATAASIRAGLCTLLLAGVLYYGLPTRLRDAIRSSVFHQPEAKAVSVSIPPPNALGYGHDSGSGRLGINLRFTIHCVPEGEVARPEMLDVTLDAPAGLRWSPGWEFASREFPVSTPAARETNYNHTLYLPREFYRAVQGAAVTIHGSMRLSLRQQTIVPLPNGQATRIPGGGYCDVSQAEAQWTVFCSSPFRRPFDTSSGSGVDVEHGPAGFARYGRAQLLSAPESPFPDFAVSPVFTVQTVSPSDAEVSLVREAPRAWIERTFAASVRMPVEH